MPILTYGTQYDLGSGFRATYVVQSQLKSVPLLEKG